MTNPATSRSGRGGARPGAGRKPSGRPPARKYGISLPAEQADRLDEAAKAENMTAGSWIARAVRKALEALR